MSRSSLSVAGTLAGLTNTAIRTALGTRSCRSPSRIAIGPREAGDKAELHRVFGNAEDDGDRRSRSFGGDRSKVAGGCGDDGHTTTREVGHESRQAIELALQPMGLHRYVLALDVARLGEALA